MASAGSIRLDTRELDSLARRLDTDVNGVIRTLAFRVVAHAKRSAPVDTGALRNSISTEPVARMTYRVQDGVEYGIYQEFGTSRMAAQPFMSPALESVRDDIETLIGREIER